jgi:hypothetical protein
VGKQEMKKMSKLGKQLSRYLDRIKTGL